MFTYNLSAFADDFSVMTYNIRGYIPCDTFKDPSHHWYYRQHYIIDVIDNESPDILGLQEIFNIPEKAVGSCNNNNYTLGYKFDPLVEKNIRELSNEGISINPPKHLLRDFMREKLKRLGYSYFYKSGGSPKIIFYKDSKYKYVNGAKIYHNYTHKKSTNFLFLKNKKTNKIILFVNTHLISGQGYAKVRRKSINTLIENILHQNSANFPIVLMGDLNIEVDSEEYKYLITKLSSINLIPAFTNKDYTYNGFSNKKKKLDYIFYSTALHKTGTKIQRMVYSLSENKLIEYNNSKKNILFPSDHWPIKAIFKIVDTKK